MKKNSNRYQSQIKSALKAFDFVQHDFRAKLPVDNSLTRYFRTNKFLGSRDRRMISRVIFGYYRWYGWLNLIKPDQANLEKVLLLAYILESSQRDDFTLFWSSEVSLEHLPPRLFSEQPEAALQEKLQYINLFDPNLRLNQLVPDFTPQWTINKLAHLQKRPNLWLRSIYQDARTVLTFLQEKKILFKTPALQSSAIEVFSPFNINECRPYKKGELEIQDISSQIIGMICNPAKNDVWWDVCAGSGGKSLHLSALAKGSIRIYATDIRPSALKALKKRVQRKWSNIVPMNWDGQSKLTFPSAVTKALVDAPCSCSGTWRRNPEIRWQLESKDIKAYANTQREILSNLAQNYPGIRTIVYATCSIMPEENELTIDHFLAQNSDFSILPVKHPLTQSVFQKGVHISPPESDGNFMYAAILKRKE